MSDHPVFLNGREPGVNVDRVNVGVGVEYARSIGFTSWEEGVVIEYALQRWGRGEEIGAIKTFRAISRNLTSWYQILAHAIGEETE